MATVGVHASCELSRPSGPDLAQPSVSFHPIDTSADARVQSLEYYLARLLFASRGLAHGHIKQSRSLPTEEPIVYCDECQHAENLGKLKHSEGCRTGAVLEVLDGICGSKPAMPNPCPTRRREDAPDAEGAELARAEFGEPWKMLAGHIYGGDFRGGREALDVRAAACVNFCAGIATERLERELPLASVGRRRWNEMRCLRQALPWLGFLPVEADDSAVLL